MKASVIIPAYNAERSIGACLASLQEQSFKDFETIVVDDGSKDRTAEVVKSFKGVKLFVQANTGPAAARNLGAEKSSGKIIIFLDSDCVTTMDWLKEMLAPFAESEVAGVQGRYKTEQNKIVARFVQLEIEERYEKMARHKYIDFIGSYAAAYRKNVFDKMNGFDTSFPMASGEDTDLSFRISKAGYKMVFNQKAIVFHTHPESLAKYLKVKFFRALWRMKIYKKHKRKMIKDAYTSQTIKLQALLFYLIFGALLLVPFFSEALYYTGILFGLLVLTTLPFSLWALTKDFAVGLVSPVIIVLRTAMFGFGMMGSILNHLRRLI
ncbi:MAG: glycosyl transferase family 2 [Candidatus Diapherotrites archaeon]|uniref:Glycosyl transferase family 2 n=1 Tax=Candidatus Iainarchaeum sp. TaxID=3101447 RepID=A0A2D6M045_9ARCH|nr:glycosyl transferase family 2 [Candidatus Diapherotrites archaeon]|tara:strand:+ start:4633 stop:5601 length:969 start_codon:yes stop_codon:yes gene_type:complete